MKYMNTPQAQIKVNLSLNMKDFLESKAKKFGIPIAGYIKHLILKDIENIDYPVYQASESTEKAYAKAVKEYNSRETLQVDDIDTFFEKV